MNRSLESRLRALEDFKRDYEKAKPGGVVPIPQGVSLAEAVAYVKQPEKNPLEERVKALENQYRMLNARLNKKNNKDADTDRRRDQGTT